MAAAKKKPALHQVPASAVPMTAEQVILARAEGVRSSFELVLGHRGLGCQKREIDALVLAEAAGDKRMLSHVLELIARRDFLEAQARGAELIDGVDDVTFF